MKEIREYDFGLGYFTEKECEIFRKHLTGTYMNFRISWSNFAGNCQLIVVTDYDAPEEEIKRFFMSWAFSKMADIIAEKN